MGRIHRLSVELANQIAAGEVVERPAAVVKELLENALDAGARRLAVAIEQGGKHLIRVQDDGVGMEPEDAGLALERHATSKIASVEDLARIETLGFRGEALPSIASVSHFTLRTRARGRASGVELRVDGGAAAGTREVGMPEGTQVEVRDLFYNVPARRKFLKSDAAESTQVSRLVTQLALGYPEVGFTLTSGSRRVLDVPPAASVEARIHQLYGARETLVPVRREVEGLLVGGFVSALTEHGVSRGPQNVFINRRLVRDRTIAHAVVSAYSEASIKERSPEIHLFLEVALDRIDVNVHPGKAEVRFRDQGFVHEVVRRAVADALGRAALPALTVDGHRVSASGGSTAATGRLPGLWARGRGGEAGVDVWRNDRSSVRETMERFPDGDQRPEDREDGGRPLEPLGQFRDTFIIAVDDQGIAIVDQHVAHERILFEQIAETLVAGRLESQQLLEPLVIELSPAGLGALVGHEADLHRLGFDVEPFGDGSVRIRAVPGVLPVGASVATIRALADDLDGLDGGSTARDALLRMSATMACHAAVKAHDRLTLSKMRYLLDELKRTEFSTVCPHGRPVLFRLDRRAIEKSFERI